MTWATKAKIKQEADDELLLTPDGEEILVGSDETDVLYCWMAYSFWNLKTK